MARPQSLASILLGLPRPATIDSTPSIQPPSHSRTQPQVSSVTAASPAHAPSAHRGPVVVGMLRYVPNALTLLRVAIASGFFVLLGIGSVRVAGGHTTGLIPIPTTILLYLAAGLFIIAALTDVLDGYLARRWNIITAFGRVMDPFADKVLVVGAFICLAGPKFQTVLPDGSHYQLTGITPWMVVAILARELLVTSIRGWMEGVGVDFSASRSGKLKEIAQSVAIPTVLILLGMTRAAPDETTRSLINGVGYATVGITLLSGLPYIQRAIKLSATLNRAADRRDRQQDSIP